MKTTPTKHYFRIKEQIEDLVFDEDISLVDIYTVLQEAKKMIGEALGGVENKLEKERNENGKETQEEKDVSRVAK